MAHECLIHLPMRRSLTTSTVSATRASRTRSVHSGLHVEVFFCYARDDDR